MANIKEILVGSVLAAEAICGGVDALATIDGVNLTQQRDSAYASDDLVSVNRLDIEIDTLHSLADTAGDATLVIGTSSLVAGLIGLGIIRLQEQRRKNNFSKA